MAVFLRSERPPTRVALVIGNSTYNAVPPLPNAARDASLITDELRAVGVEVHSYTDLDKSGMDAAIAATFDRLKEVGSVDSVIFYFSGHSFQEKGVNYLLPVDGKEDEMNSVALQGMIDKLSENSRRRLVFLDACRSYLNTHQVEDDVMRTRSIPAGETIEIERGLADFDIIEDTFISFSAAPGKPAYDSGIDGGQNSPYADALARYLGEVDLPLSVMMARVRNSVLHNTSEKQKTWDSSSLKTGYFFNPSSLLFLVGNALALIGASVAVLSSGVVLYETAIAEHTEAVDGAWIWVYVSLVILALAVAIFLYGVGRAYSRVRGEQSDWQTEGAFKLFRWSSAGTFGALGGILGGIIVPAFVVLPYWWDWRNSTTDWRILERGCADRAWFDPFMPDHCPKLGQLLAEGGLAGVYILVLLGFFCMHFSEWMTRGRPAVFFHDIRGHWLLVAGSIVGGLVAGTLVGPVITTYFGAQDRPFLEPRFVVVPSIAAVALMAFCVVNYRLETFTLARLVRSLIGAAVGTLAGAAVIGVILAFLYTIGFVQGTLTWAGDIYYDNYNIGYVTWQRYGALMVAGLPYGLVFGTGFGILIAVTRLSTEPELLNDGG